MYKNPLIKLHIHTQFKTSNLYLHLSHLEVGETFPCHDLVSLDLWWWPLTSLIFEYFETRLGDHFVKR